MKKHLLIFSLMFFALLGSAEAQHLKGMKGMFVAAGASKLGITGKIGGIYNTGRKTYLTADFMLEKGRVASFDFSTYNLSATFYYSAFKVQDKFFLNFGPGLTGNISRVAGADPEDYGGNHLQQTDFGIIGAIEGEYYLSKSFAFTLNYDQRFFLTNNFGSLAWYAGIGGKLVIF